MHHKAHGERTIEKISHALDLIECVIKSIQNLNFRLGVKLINLSRLIFLDEACAYVPWVFLISLIFDSAQLLSSVVVPISDWETLLIAEDVWFFLDLQFLSPINLWNKCID